MARSASPDCRACSVRLSIPVATRRARGACRRSSTSSVGSSVMWLASVMQIRNWRSVVSGSKLVSQCANRRSDSRISRPGTIKVSARGVGDMPAGVRTNSGSPSWSRSRPSQMLAVGWLRPSCSAARVTLRVR